MKKILASLALAGLLTLGAGTVAAQAAPPAYPAGPGATVSSGTVTPGEPVTFAGSGFTAGEIIDITVTQTSTVAGGAIGSMGGGGFAASVPIIMKPAAPSSFTTTAAADGTFSVPVTLDKTGTYTLTAKGRTSGVTVSQVVKVVTGTDNGAGNTNGNGNNVAGNDQKGLANTGVDASVLIWSLVGAGALAGGVATVVVSRRRSRESVDA